MTTSGSRIAHRLQAFFLHALLIAAVLICAQQVASAVLKHRALWPYDLRAIYCGLHVTAAGGDPYLVEPLKSCEVALASPVAGPLPDYVLPAPLPPYAQWALSPVGTLGPDGGLAAFYALITAATVGSIVALRRLTGMPYVYLAPVLLFGLQYQSGALGQVTPLCFAGIVFAARAVHLGRFKAAALWLLPTFIQPQLGLTIGIAAFVAEPRMRKPLLLLTALPLAAYAAVRFPQILEYLQFLQYHSRAEIHEIFQVSLSFVLVQLHVPEETAIRIGSAVSLCWIALAAIAARRLRRGDAMLVALPAAISVLPGAFEHPLFLEYAVPCGFLVLARSPRNLAAATGIGLQSVFTIPFTILKSSAISACSIVAALALMARSRAGRAVTVCVSVAFVALFAGIARDTPLPDAGPHAHAAVRFASEEWLELALPQPALTPILWWKKVPNVLGLFLIVGAALRGVFATRPENELEPGRVR